MTFPLPILLWCPGCGRRHIDEGRWVSHPHHTHACQECGIVWRPAIVPTVGVRFLPGLENDAAVSAELAATNVLSPIPSSEVRSLVERLRTLASEIETRLEP